MHMCFTKLLVFLLLFDCGHRWKQGIVRSIRFGGTFKMVRIKGYNLRQYHRPDKEFYENLLLLDFPMTYVGMTRCMTVTPPVLSTIGVYHLVANVDGKLMPLEEAREVSNAFRSYEITPQEGECLEHHERHFHVKFRPIPEKLMKGWKNQMDETEEGYHTYFVELRVLFVSYTAISGQRRLRSGGPETSKAVAIRVDCGGQSTEGEWPVPMPGAAIDVARIYISGRSVMHNVMHYPHELRFNTVNLFDDVEKDLQFINGCTALPIELRYVKISGFHVTPAQFIIQPGEDILLTVKCRPCSNHIQNKIKFTILGPIEPLQENDYEMLDTYVIPVKVSVAIQTIYKPLKQKSDMYLAKERMYRYALTKDQQKLAHVSKNSANQFLKNAYAERKAQLPVVQTKPDYFISCSKKLAAVPMEDNIQLNLSFNKVFMAKDINFVKVTPDVIDFGNVAPGTPIFRMMTITNDWRYDVKITFTVQNKLQPVKRKTFIIKPMVSQNIQIMYIGSKLDKNSIEYTINDSYYFEMPVKMNVRNKCVIVSPDVINLHPHTYRGEVRVDNAINIPIAFKWEIGNELQVIPETGIIDSMQSILCSVFYKTTNVKFSSDEIILKDNNNQVMAKVPVTVNQVEQVSVSLVADVLEFGSIPLNLPTSNSAYLYNNNKFSVDFSWINPPEPIPGLRVSPSKGTLKAMSFVAVEIELTFPVPMAFNFSIMFLINSKDHVNLTIQGTVIYPQVYVYPEVVAVPRIPINLVGRISFTLHNMGMQPTQVCIPIKSVSPAFTIELNRNEDSENAFINLYPGEKKVVHMHICSDRVTNYDFYLPLIFNNMVGPPSLKDESSIHPENYWKNYLPSYRALKFNIYYLPRRIPLVRIQGTISEELLRVRGKPFKCKIACYDHKPIIFSIDNFHITTTTVTFDLREVIKSPSFMFKAMSSKAICKNSTLTIELAPNTSEFFQVNFSTTLAGFYSVEIPFYSDDDPMAIFYNIRINVKYMASAVKPIPSEIYIPPLNLGLSTERSIQLYLKQHYGRTPKIAHKFFPPVKGMSIDYGDLIKIDQTTYTINIIIKIAIENAMQVHTILVFKTSLGASCEVDIYLSTDISTMITYVNRYIPHADNPYPFFPEPCHGSYYTYMMRTVRNLEMWLFEQGFAREVYTEIPQGLIILSEGLKKARVMRNNYFRVSILNLYHNLAGINIRKMHVFANGNQVKHSIHSIYLTYKNILEFLLGQGARFIHVRPEFLLRHHEYVLYLAEIKLENERITPLMKQVEQSQERFHLLSKQCWMDVILQTYKVLVLDRIVDSMLTKEILINAPVLNNYDAFFIAWFNFIIQDQHKKLSSLCYRTSDEEIEFERITLRSIEEGFQNGIALIAITNHFCPYMEKSLKGIYYPPTRHEHRLHNIIKAISTWEMLRINFKFVAKDIAASGENLTYLTMLIAHLYIILPTLAPRKTIIMSAKHYHNVKKSIVLTGRNVIYSLHFLYNEDDCFTVDTNSLKLTSGKPSTFILTFTAKRVSEVQAVLLACGDCEGNRYAENIVMIIHGRPLGLDPLERITRKVPMYRIVNLYLDIRIPHRTLEPFSVQMEETEPLIDIMNMDLKYKNIPFEGVRCCLLSKIVNPSFDGKENSRAKIVISACTLTLKKRRFWFIMKSKVANYMVSLTLVPFYNSEPIPLLAAIKHWPPKRCSCGIICQCYRILRVQIPCRNEEQRTCLTQLVTSRASAYGLNFFLQHINSNPGCRLLQNLFYDLQSSTGWDETQHIFEQTVVYQATIEPPGIFTFAPTLTIKNTVLKGTTSLMTLVMPDVDNMVDLRDYHQITLTLISECGREQRVYRLIINGTQNITYRVPLYKSKKAQKKKQ